MLCPGDYPTEPNPQLANFTTHQRWFKNDDGWVHAVVRCYSNGDKQQDYLEWGLSDQEYFKRKLAGTA